MKKTDWNPELYLRYEKERTQPSIDLMARINTENPKNIIDIGCGPGNSTQVLCQKYPLAKIVGIDKSPAMIEKAKQDFPNQEWRVVDAEKEEINEKFDIIFSNAVIQWIPNHERLLKRFYEMLNKKGTLAVQMPLFWDMPLGKAIENISQNEEWREQTRGAKELFTIYDYPFYYDILSEVFESFTIWETYYIHEMDSYDSILEMIRSTGLRPYVDKLENQHHRQKFEDMVLKEIEKDYPIQKNGKVLFPFKRLFFTAIK